MTLKDLAKRYSAHDKGTINQKILSLKLKALHIMSHEDFMKYLEPKDCRKYKALLKILMVDEL